MALIETQQEAVGLPSIRRGGRAIVVALQGDLSIQNRLRELGLYESSEVTVLHINGTILCQVNGSRFGLDRSIAANVLVQPA